MRLRDRGLVGTDDGHYRFSGDFEQLHKFAREFTHHLHRRRLESVAPSGMILWADHDEFLAQTETETDAAYFHETGLARFAAFDLQLLLTSHRYYFYSEDVESISPAELCCHTLLIDDDTRHRSYCLLLLSHVLKREYEDEEHPFGWMQDGVFELFDNEGCLYRWRTEEDLIEVTSELP